MSQVNFKTKVSESFERQKFMKHLNAELILIEEGICHIGLPYQKNLSQQHGFIHAGVISTLADNAAGYAAYSVMAETSSVLTVEYKINLVAPGIGDYFIAKAELVKKGRNITICRSDVYAQKDGQEKLCATAQCTLMELHNQPDQ